MYSRGTLRKYPYIIPATLPAIVGFNLCFPNIYPQAAPAIDDDVVEIQRSGHTFPAALVIVKLTPKSIALNEVITGKHCVHRATKISTMAHRINMAAI